LDILEHKKFPLRHSVDDIVGQLQVAKNRLPKVTAKSGHEGLACMIRESIDLLERKARTVTRKVQGNRISQGFDYLVIAEMPPSSNVVSEE
jgi:hypothetical protein